MSTKTNQSVETINTDTLVIVSNDQPTTTSLKIAEYFGKLHKDILRKIETLETSQDFTERNFTPSSYIDNSGKSNPMYQITKDGFTLLTMGFTGAKALKFKVDYINAFNKMEQILKNQTQAPAPQTTNQFDFLRGLLNNLETQAKEITQIKYEVQELKETPRIVNLEMKNLIQLKGFRQMQKNEVGSSINKCVEKIGKMHGFKVILDPDFPIDMKKAKYILNTGDEATAGEFFAKQHHFCHELYSAGAETYYAGAESATLEEKEQYRIWLNNYLAKNHSRLV